jgi:hypothetical protein
MTRFYRGLSATVVDDQVQLTSAGSVDELTRAWRASLLNERSYAQQQDQRRELLLGLI